jgi:hypothetical protein
MDYQIDRHLIELDGIDYSIVSNFQFIERIRKTTNRFHSVVMWIRIFAEYLLYSFSNFKPTLL